MGIKTTFTVELTTDGEQQLKWRLAERIAKALRFYDDNEGFGDGDVDGSSATWTISVHSPVVESES